MDSQPIRQLGTLTATFGPSFVNLVAGFILALLSMIAGAALAILWWVSDQESRSTGADYFSVVFPVSLFGGGLALLIWLLRLCSLRVQVFSNGFVLRYRGKAEVFLWSDVAGVEQQLVQVGEFTPGWKYVVKRSDGFVFAFDANRIRSHDRLGKLIRLEVLARGVPWTILDPDGS